MGRESDDLVGGEIRGSNRALIRPLLEDNTLAGIAAQSLRDRHQFLCGIGQSLQLAKGDLVNAIWLRQTASGQAYVATPSSGRKRIRINRIAARLNNVAISAEQRISKANERPAPRARIPRHAQAAQSRSRWQHCHRMRPDQPRYLAVIHEHGFGRGINLEACRGNKPNGKPARVLLAATSSLFPLLSVSSRGFRISS